MSSRQNFKIVLLEIVFFQNIKMYTVPFQNKVMILASLLHDVFIHFIPFVLDLYNYSTITPVFLYCF
jgi:hypothetical protein